MLVTERAEFSFRHRLHSTLNFCRGGFFAPLVGFVSSSVNAQSLAMSRQVCLILNQGIFDAGSRQRGADLIFRHSLFHFEQACITTKEVFAEHGFTAIKA